MRKKPTEAPQNHPPCAAEGCLEPGEYKAPKSRFENSQYQFLCLTHVREFNHAWDYFDGWDRDQIETFMHEAPYGHRPTWKIGSQPLFTSDSLRDSFFKMMGEAPPKSQTIIPKVPQKEREALADLNLEPGADLSQIKIQYKKLVKKYHPDVNKGDKELEENFKRVTIAYTYLTKLYGKKDET